MSNGKLIEDTMEVKHNEAMRVRVHELTMLMKKGNPTVVQQGDMLKMFIMQNYNLIDYSLMEIMLYISKKAYENLQGDFDLLRRNTGNYVTEKEINKKSKSVVGDEYIRQALVGIKLAGSRFGKESFPEYHTLTGKVLKKIKPTKKDLEECNKTKLFTLKSRRNGEWVKE